MEVWINEIMNVCFSGLIPVFVAFFLYAVDFVREIRGQ